MSSAATGPKSHPPLPAPEPLAATSSNSRAGTASGGFDLGDGGHASVTSARCHGSGRTRDDRLGRRQPGAYPPLTGPRATPLTGPMPLDQALSDWRPVDEHANLPRHERMPLLVSRQRLGDDDRDAIARRRLLGEVDGDVVVLKRGTCE